MKRVGITHRQANRSGGFAIMTCIIFIGFVGVAIATMTAQFAAEMGRTRHAVDDSQVRQMLTWAAIDLSQRSQIKDFANSDVQIEFSLPKELAARNAKLSATPKINLNGLTFAISANLGTRSASQTIEFRKAGQRWKLHAARSLSQP